MKKHLSLLVFCCTMLLLHADTVLPLNGNLKQVLDGIPLGWGCPPAPQLRYVKEGGPDGLPYVTFGEDSTGGSMVQENMTLVPWEHYLLSVKVRTKGFKAKGFALIITDSGWYDSVGIREVPETTDWTTIEAKIRCLNSKRLNGYALRCNVRDKTAGTLDIADIKLIPLTEKATTSMPLSTIFSAMPSSMTMPHVVVETRQPARRASSAKSKKCGLRNGSPQPCRCTRSAQRSAGHSAANVSGDISLLFQHAASTVCGQ